MSIYHLSAKIVSRGKGQSAIAKAAYNARDRLTDERTGEVKDFSRADGLMFSGIFAPKDAPDWAHDREQLWNHAEAAETRKNSQLAREVEISLPHELTDEQREELVKDFVREQFVRRGMVADVNIHAPDREGDQRNYHAHILLTTREISAEGFGAKNRDWNSTESLEAWREGWERTANRTLERHGHEPTLDRRTLEAQGIEREPSLHIGVHAQAMERQGIETERGDAVREIAERNAEREGLTAELREVQRDIARDVAESFDREGPRLSGRFTAHEPGDEEMRAGSGALEVATRGVEAVLGGVLDFLAGDGKPPPTPEQQRKAAQRAERQAAAQKYFEERDEEAKKRQERGEYELDSGRSLERTRERERER